MVRFGGEIMTAWGGGGVRDWYQWVRFVYIDLAMSRELLHPTTIGTRELTGLAGYHDAVISSLNDDVLI